MRNNCNAAVRVTNSELVWVSTMHTWWKFYISRVLNKREQTKNLNKWAQCSWHTYGIARDDSTTINQYYHYHGHHPKTLKNLTLNKVLTEIHQGKHFLFTFILENYMVELSTAVFFWEDSQYISKASHETIHRKANKTQWFYNIYFNHLFLPLVFLLFFFCPVSLTPLCLSFFKKIFYLKKYQVILSTFCFGGLYMYLIFSVGNLE